MFYNYYFEVAGMAIDDEGNDCLAGVELKLPEWYYITDEDMEDTAEKVAKALGLNKDDVRLITMDEYDDKYRY